MVLAVTDQLQEDLCEDKPVLMGLSLSNEVLLVPQRPFRAELDEELNNSSQAAIGVCLAMELLEEIYYDAIATDMQEVLLSFSLLLLSNYRL